MPEDNPFLRLQAERLAAGGRSHAQGCLAGLASSVTPTRRRATREWIAAWREAFGSDMDGYSAGQDAWRPLRGQMSAHDFIARYMKE